MRIRIRQPRSGEIDGVPLKFQVGVIYDVPSSVATYLITTGCAEFVLTEGSASVHPHDQIVVINKE